ncbi:hypothetical protein [Salimicrobium flavidum]|nr:hypothetical protein [Salimicrobium flavidum]
MKKYFYTIGSHLEKVDQRTDNNITFISIILALIAPAVLDESFAFGVMLVLLLLSIRFGWDFINSNAKEQKRYKQTLSIMVVFVVLAAITWFVIRILLPYPFGIVY